jgi:hypothetical protein
VSADPGVESADVADDPPDEVDPARERSRGRRWVSALLIGLATVLVIVSATTTWVRTQALETDEWVAVSSELLEEPVVREALATYLVDELYANVDVGAELESFLPEDLSGLAGPLAGALRGPASEAAERVLASPVVQQVWEDANRIAHQTFVAIIRDETRENVSTAEGSVVLDLGGAVRTIGAELGVPDGALDRIPDDVGEITVFESSVLADVQDLIRVLDVLSWFLFVVVVVLYVLAVYLARGRRRETLRNVGLALVAAGLVVLALRAVAVRSTVDFLVEDPANEPAARAVANIATELLDQMASTGVVVGLVIALYAALIGPHAWAVAVRRRLAASSSPDLIITGAAVAVLVVLVWWSPGRMFDRWVTALTTIGLIIGAGVALAVTVRRESGTAGTTTEVASAEVT